MRWRVVAGLVGSWLLLAGCSDDAGRTAAVPDTPPPPGLLLEEDELDGFEKDNYRPRPSEPVGLPFCLQVRREDRPESLAQRSFVDLTPERNGIEARLYETVGRYRPGAAAAYLEAVRKAVVSCETAGNPPLDVPSVRYELRPGPTLGDDALAFEEISNGGLIASDEVTTLIRIEDTIVTLSTFTVDGAEANLPEEMIERAVARARQG